MTVSYLKISFVYLKKNLKLGDAKFFLCSIYMSLFCFRLWPFRLFREKRNCLKHSGLSYKKKDQKSFSFYFLQVFVRPYVALLEYM